MQHKLHGDLRVVQAAPQSLTPFMAHHSTVPIVPKGVCVRRHTA